MRGNPANRTTFVTEKNFREDDLTGSCSFGNEYFVRFFLDEKTRKNKYSSDLVDKELNWPKTDYICRLFKFFVCS